MDRRTMWKSAALAAACWGGAGLSGVFAKSLARKEDALIFWNSEEVFVLECGDGRPEFMHKRHEIRFVEEYWFNDQARRQPASLFIVVDEELAGQYIALSSRRQISIEEQMLQSGMASVVVNVVRNPTATYGQNVMEDVSAVGMTVLRRRGDSRFE